MMRSLFLAGVLLAFLNAQAEGQPLAQRIVHVEGDGPTARATALAFSPDGRTLYAAGYDKVVRVWERKGDQKTFTLAPHAYRVPIGPGLGGVLNALAVSPDGKWLAATGLGVGRDDAGFGEQGPVYPADATPSASRLDRGTVYLFDLRPGSRDVHYLRAATGVGYALAFLPVGKDGRSYLVSAALDPETRDGQLCLWDVNKAVSGEDGNLAEQTLPRLASTLPPQLAVHRYGERPTQVRTAIAWSDGQFRVWDVATQNVAKLADGSPLANSTAAFLGSGKWLTGGYDSQAGYLHTWDEERTTGLPTSAQVRRLRDEAYGFQVPRSLAILPEKRVAMVTQSRRANSNEIRYELQILDFDDLKSQGTVDLWPKAAAASAPIFAASPNGSHVAVAGGGQRGVRVYRVDDIRPGKDATPQVLSSAGVLIRSVAFVRQGKRTGLLLSERPAGKLGRTIDMARTDLLLDPAQGGLSRDPAGQKWELAHPLGWTLEQDANTLQWSGPKRTNGKVALRLDKDEKVTAAALLPPLSEGLPPLLAVATWNAGTGEPLLIVHEANSGARLRLFKGHGEPIQSLAASDDGRLLASAADDHTVSLWSLTDIQDILGKHGTLDGLRLRFNERTQTLILDDVKDAAARAGLLKGDRIQGLGLPGGDRPLADLTPLKFYETLWHFTLPRTSVDLHVIRQDGPVKKVPLETTQGMDDRKPLLTLFLASKPGAKVPEWIGWTPTGLFESGGQQVEKYVGWYFNPSELGKPVQFASLREYREIHEERQLVVLLLEHATLGAVEKRRAIPRPNASLQLNGPRVERLAANEWLVRDSQVEVQLVVRGPSLKDGQLATATLEINGREETFDLLNDASGQTLSRTLTLPRGANSLSAVVRSRNPNHEPATAKLTVLRALPRPTIEVKDPTDDSQILGDGVVIVRDPEVALRASASPNAVLNRLEVNGRAVDAKLPGVRIDEKLRLREGENVLLIAAVPAERDRRVEPYEIAERTLTVLYQKRDSAPVPLFTAVEVDPGTTRARRLRVESGRPILVDSRSLRILGTVPAPMKLSRVALKPSEGVQLVEPMKTPGAAVFDLDQRVVLADQPGRLQEFVLEAQTATSETGKATLKVEFRPALPDLELAPLPPTLTEGENRPGGAELEVRGFLTPPNDAYPFDVLLQVFHRRSPGEPETADPPIVKALARTTGEDGAPVSLGTVPIRPGVNRIEASVRNRWRTPERTVVESVTYRRPPFLLNVQATPPTNRPFTTLTAEVDAPADLPVKPEHIRVNDSPPLAERLKLIETKRPGGASSRWQIQIQDVALSRKGANAIRLQVENADGSASKETRVDLAFDPAAPILFTVAGSGQVREPRYELKLTIRSFKKALRRVDVLADGMFLARLDPRTQQTDAQGFFQLERTFSGELTRGTTTFRIEAENESGFASETASVTYLPPPVRLVIEPPTEEAKTDALRFTGRVVWSDTREPRQVEAELKRKIRIAVNGFRQQTVLGDIRFSKGTLEFTAEAVLNQPVNHVQIRTPGLPLESGDRHAFALASAKPRPLGALRVLVVDAFAGRQREEPLERLTRTALRVAPSGGGRLNNGVFANVVSYPFAPQRLVPVAIPYLRRESVQLLLDQMNRDAGANDLLLVYWNGLEGVYEGKHYLLTSVSRNRPAVEWPEKALPMRDLLGADGLGARIVLLDTVPTGSADELTDYGDDRAALLRWIWPTGKTPPLGLLAALQAAGNGKSRVTLRDVTSARPDLGEQPSAEVQGNLDRIPHLAEIPLIGAR